MIAEFNVYGVFVPALLIFAIIAFALLLALRYAFDVAGLYRFVWHRPLFDSALFIILFGAVAALAESAIGIFRHLLPGIVV
jgi:hypothetical protein